MVTALQYYVDGFVDMACLFAERVFKMFGSWNSSVKSISCACLLRVNICSKLLLITLVRCQLEVKVIIYPPTPTPEEAQASN